MVENRRDLQLVGDVVDKENKDENASERERQTDHHGEFRHEFQLDAGANRSQKDQAEGENGNEIAGQESKKKQETTSTKKESA